MPVAQWLSGSFKRPLQASANAQGASSPLGKELAEVGMICTVIPRDRIKLGRVLGSGAFGKVFVADVSGWAEPTVGKIVKPKKMEPKDVKLLKLEMTIWSTIDHPHCLRMLGVSLEPSEYCLLSQLCHGGSMGDAIARLRAEKRPKPAPAELASMMRQMAGGMVHLHEHGVMHRDLKSPNILLESKGNSLYESCPLKIADFGLARHLPLEDRASSLTAETGSYRWMAPEVIRHEPYNSACDVYSFAIVCCEMITYELPFADDSAVQAAFAVATKHRRPTFTTSGDGTIDALIAECWHADGGKRPTFAAVVERLQPKAHDAAPEAERSPAVAAAQPAAGPSESGRRTSEGAMKRPASISSGILDLGLEVEENLRKSPRSSPEASRKEGNLMVPGELKLQVDGDLLAVAAPAAARAVLQIPL